MRLECLEISGFKSFSDRSELSFDKGVTAIVGPNGCGKSNVADAITWVMGEQSAKSLRGEHMEDVIFSGSDARRPTAAAEVRLRLSGVVQALTAPAFDQGIDHSGSNGNGNGHGGDRVIDQDSQGVEWTSSLPASEELIRSVSREVEVTRRLYRSGESEYLIDGQVCRLRDVHELLMDTGLGAKAYAIIEQGKIGMILSSRPTDRRQLLEEAAGITKYKARRRAAELKLEAAQANLTRVDDIVFEVEKQRGTLKRQAAKARRYRRLKDELRRWEKQLFARQYLQLAETIEATRVRLAEARDHESAAAARVTEIDARFGGVRIELVEAESRATACREAAHTRELAINRLQQQRGFDTEQIASLTARSAALVTELEAVEARQGPARTALAERRASAAAAELDREQAAIAMGAESEAVEVAQREIESLEADVEGARSEVFSAINAATALRHSLEHAAAARGRVAETLSKLAVETDDVRNQGERLDTDHQAGLASLRTAQEAIDATRCSRANREAELNAARTEHGWRARSLRTGEHELAGLEARLKSFEEIEAARAQYGDAARVVLAQANGKVGQRGAVADYLEVDVGYERAVEACLGDLLQHVLVERTEDAAAGLALLRDDRAGRCGFLIAKVDSRADSVATGNGSSSAGTNDARSPAEDGIVPLSSVYRVSGPYVDTIRAVIGEGWIADSYDRAAAAAHRSPYPVVTVSGDVFRGPHLLMGGSPEEARGILETKRAIRELRERIETDRAALARLAHETAGFETLIAEAHEALSSLNADEHRQEKAIIAQEAALQRSSEERSRVALRLEQLSRERRQAEEERNGLDRRQAEAELAVARLEGQQRMADERLTDAQRKLFEARESAQELNRRVSSSHAAHAGLVERASALRAEVQRLEEVVEELRQRSTVLSAGLDTARNAISALKEGCVRITAELDENVRVLDSLATDVRQADEAVSLLHATADSLEVSIRDARVELESRRQTVAELDIARATAQGDLGHLAQACLDLVQATLDDVVAEVAALEEQGVSPNAAVVSTDERDDQEDAPEESSASVPADARTLAPEEIIATLRDKVDRLGPVNMMAIEQFDELETRHAFLSSQRKDLVDSIAQTSETIRRIDKATRHRFTEAFEAINRNFHETFSTLFGGGQAGLTLLDESDPLESGIEIIAQPPGKRLQSVQLLSGGEKALTAIALMFGLFKYKPSPFCLLDEIDAPLDDANIGRFVEMLRGMQQHTQFILITHNRKTMEIADRLYGVTMEEPGVSKLISVQLN